jgi:hypothetical protein
MMNDEDQMQPRMHADRKKNPRASAFIRGPLSVAFVHSSFIIHHSAFIISSGFLQNF